MRNLLKASAIAMTIAASASTIAGNLYLDLGTNSFDAARTGGAVDANTTTGVFTEFGFSQLLATSIYDTDGAGNLTGIVTDTNIAANLTAAGIPASGTALDGVTNVSIGLPNCGAGQCDIDALSPLAPPVNFSDSEGFLSTWDIQVEYNLIADISSGAPVYTGGYIEFFFNGIFDNSMDRSVFRADVTGSSIQAANLNIFFDVTAAEVGFMFVMDNNGNYQDAGLLAASGDFAKFALDTNVNPPIPTANQLLLVGNKAVRQTTLDGSITATVVPEPSTIALLGLSLIGFGVASRRRK